MPLVVRIILVAGLTAAAVLAAVRPLFACSCHDGGPVCEAFWKTPVVFAGRVEAISKLPRGTEYGAHERVRFRVIEALRGTTARELELFNYRTTCHFTFTAGEDWLIYAFPRFDGPGLTTYTCSRSRPLAEGQEDLSYARAAHSNVPDKGRVFGQITYPIIGPSRTWRPVASAEVTITGDWFESVAVTTDRGGHYEIRAPAGSYRLSVKLPPGMSLRPSTRIIDLPDARGCAAVDLRAEYPGHVTGRVLTASGSAVPNLVVELLSADTSHYGGTYVRGLTDDAGRFSVGGVTPGRYVAAVTIGYGEFDTRHDGIETRFAFTRGATTQNDAPVVEVTGGSRASIGDFVLPKAVRIAQVTGVVMTTNGRPAAGIKVRAKADFDNWGLWTTVRTDARGRFAVGLPSGIRYRLVAETAEPDMPAGRQSAAIRIDPSPAMPPLRLVVR